MHDEEAGIHTGMRGSANIEFDFTAKRDAAGTMAPVRKLRNKHLAPAPAKLDNQTNFMLEVSNIAAKDVDGLKLGTSIMSTCGKYIYHLSIIDYLQKYDYKKKVERWHKISVKHAEPSHISSININAYGKRFMKFMQEKVLDPDFNRTNDLVTEDDVQSEMADGAHSQSIISRGIRLNNKGAHNKMIVEDFYEKYEDSINEGKALNDSKIPKTNHASSNMGRNPTAMETHVGWRPHDAKAELVDARFSINDLESIADSDAEDMLLQKMGFREEQIRQSRQNSIKYKPSFKVKAPKGPRSGHVSSKDQQTVQTLEQEAVVAEESKKQGRQSEDIYPIRSTSYDGTDED